MSGLDVVVDLRKCQSYGACLKSAPEVFRLGEDNKAQIVDSSAAPDEVVLKAARSCPYRAITVIASETGEQLHPRVKK